MNGLTDANFTANLKTARTVIAQQQGVDPLNMTLDQRNKFNMALAQYISQYPNSFAPGVADMARRILQAGGYGSLQDTSLDFGQFFDDTLQNANDLNPLNIQGTVGKWFYGIAFTVLILWLTVKASQARQVLKDD